jgi:hypothetical protein
MESLLWSALFAPSAGLIFLLKLAQFVPAFSESEVLACGTLYLNWNEIDSRS